MNSRHRVFRYYRSEQVRVGDKVRTGNYKRGIVKMVIMPSSQASEDFSCPQERVLIEEDWDGLPCLILETPPDGEHWEDIEFVERG